MHGINRVIVGIPYFNHQAAACIGGKSMSAAGAFSMQSLAQHADGPGTLFFAETMQQFKQFGSVLVRQVLKIRRPP
jgi:hypothetical protein